MLALLLALACATTPSPEPAPQAPATEEVAPEPAPAEAPAQVEAPPAPVPADAAPAEAPAAAPVVTPMADGGACLLPADCASGVCEGQGCDAASPGKCAPKQRACTRDRRPFCGCDGQVFQSSSSCPGQRYAKPGPC